MSGFGNFGVVVFHRFKRACCILAACLLSACCSLSPPKETLQPKKAVTLTRSYLRPDHRDWVRWTPSLSDGNVRHSVVITTGSLLGFSSKAASGRLIRFMSGDRREGFSHVGMAIVAYPSEILRLVKLSSKIGGLSTRTPEYTAYQLRLLYRAHPYLRRIQGEVEIDEPLDVFVFEAVSDAKLIRKDGIYSCVMLTPLSLAVNEHHRDACVRTLLPSMDLESLQSIIVQELGISYELKKGQLLRATTDANKKEDGSSWFCSELVTYVYKVAGVLGPNVGYANNVVPMEFASYNRDDLLKGKAAAEQWIKRVKR